MSPDAGAPPLLFVNMHYYPDVAATAHHLTDLAEALAARGEAVEVLTRRAHYADQRLEAPARETRHGVAIERVSTTAFGRGTTLGRLADYASFYLRVLTRALSARPYRGIVFMTTPPLMSVIGLVARRVRGRRYAIWSQDLHPDAEFAAGMLDPKGIVGRLIEWLNRIGYRGADAVVALGDHMRARIAAKGVATGRLHVVPVWVSDSELAPLPRASNALAREFGVEGRFVVAYIGNAGLAHDFDAILEAMRRLHHDDGVRFVFVGDGPRRAAIEAFAREHAISNAIFRGYYPRERVRELYALADVHLVSLAEPFVGIAVPTKLYVAMGTGRPVAFVGPRRSESGDAVVASGGGVVVDPAGGDAADRLVASLREWRADPRLAIEVGARGRAYAVEAHGRAPNIARFAALLEGEWPADRDDGAPRSLPAGTRPAVSAADRG